MKKKLTPEQQANLEKALAEQKESSKKYDEEIKQNRINILKETKQNGLYSFIEKVVEENKELIEKTIKKHGLEQKWIKNWIVGKINENVTDEDITKATGIERDKFSFVFLK
jgi:3-oxoacyl-[acyl-carrier-protein] synthase III